MKLGNFWMTTIGAGVVIAGMMTAGRAAMQSPAFLFLAGQIKVASGQTEEGMRLMNEAATQRESGTVHAAEPALKPTEVCTKTKPQAEPAARPATAVRPVKATVTKKAPVMMLAKLDFPRVPAAANVPTPGQFQFDPAAFQYMSNEERTKFVEAQVQAQMANREKMRELRRMAHAVVIRYTPPAQGFGPADISNIERDLPVALGQVVQ